MSDQQPKTCEVPVAAGLYLRLRCNGDGTSDFMQIASPRYDTIMRVDAHSQGVTIVTTSTGRVINTVHTEEEVLAGIEQSQKNHAEIIKGIGGLVEAMKVAGA